MSKTSRSKSISDGYLAAIRRLIAFLRQMSAIPEQIPLAVEMTQSQVAVFTFGQHLLQDQGLSQRTCIQYSSFIKQFLVERFENGPINFIELNAADVVGFIKSQAIRLSRSRAKSATIALRSYMRYLRFRGEIKLDLAAAVPTVPNWSMTGIPRAISAEHVKAVLASCCRDTPVGCRDFAILLLLARLGLRSSEIVSLTLDSIDWDIGCITVIGKGGQSTQLPLPAEVGEAIAVYLQRGRPRCNYRVLFLCATAPIRGLGSHTSIGSIVLSAITRAKIETKYKGAHQFRHALACEMLRQGASMTEIGSLLRHRHSKTTCIYAKVDFAALRPLALAGSCIMITLRSLLEDYLTMRRGLGFKLQTEGTGLLAFVSFMEQQQTDFITNELALKWAQQPTTVQVTQCARRLSFVRGFARYCSAIDARTQVPPTDLIPWNYVRPSPYFFTDDDIKKILDASLKTHSKDKLLCWTYHCLFGLLSVTGMRIGEARGLSLEDVDLDDAILTIRSSKFGKSRIVPLHASTVDVLADYLQRRQRVVPKCSSNLVFVNERGLPLGYEQPLDTFQRLSKMIGLGAQGKRLRPHLHDLRHRFALQTLMHWYRGGEDVARRLPVLSAFLGHTEVRDTYWYLSARPELLELAKERLESYWEQ